MYKKMPASAHRSPTSPSFTLVRLLAVDLLEGGCGSSQQSALAVRFVVVSTARKLRRSSHTMFNCQTDVLETSSASRDSRPLWTNRKRTVAEISHTQKQKTSIPCRRWWQIVLGTTPIPFWSVRIAKRLFQHHSKNCNPDVIIVQMKANKQPVRTTENFQRGVDFRQTFPLTAQKLYSNWGEVHIS